jgi:hypothetical protein
VCSSNLCVFFSWVPCAALSKPIAFVSR